MRKTNYLQNLNVGKNMQVCTECKYKNADNAQHCNRCRQPLSFEAPDKKRYSPVVIVIFLMTVLFVAFMTIKILSETGVI